MRVRVKICCIASPEEAASAVAAGADALGLVGAMPSGPGPIPDDLIARIAAGVPPPVTPILLTRETEADAIADHVARTGAPAVQIVSRLDPIESARLARLIPRVKRLQVVHVEGRDALDLVAVHGAHVHAFLLDSGRPSEGVLGGTGRTHDWEISAAFVRASPIPVFLAGGLHAGNVAQAIAAVRPFGVDLCTGVRVDGRLDAGRLSAFMAAVRAASA